MKHPGEQRRGAGCTAAMPPAPARTHLGGDAPPAAESLVGGVHSAAGLCRPAVSHAAQLGAAGRVQHREGGGSREPAAAHEAVGAQQRGGQAPGVGAERGASRRPAARPREEAAAGTHQTAARDAAAPQPRAGRHGPGGGRKEASKRASGRQEERGAGTPWGAGTRLQVAETRSSALSRELHSRARLNVCECSVVLVPGKELGIRWGCAYGLSPSPTSALYNCSRAA